ncbi:hypothetical protein [Microbacterium sp. LWO12-1.2]|uniref:hypothetical protein n=1 Tax=Microbacterium sp. LWO12-1.2 TaxID=3135261 RepID=UPI00341ED11A
MTRLGRVRAARDVFTSGTFFTPWSWVLTAPFALTILGGHDAASTGRDPLAGVAIAAAVHVLCGLPGILAAGGERATSSRGARAGIVVTTLLMIGVMRPVLIGWFTQQAGLPAFPVPISIRITTNLFAVVVATTLIAILVGSLRRRKETVAELGIVAGWLNAERTYGRRLFAAVDRVLADVERALLVRLDELEHQGGTLSASAQAELLRAFSGTAVRSASRRLYELREGDALAASLEKERPPSPPARPRGMRLAPAATGTPITLYLVLLAPFALARLPLTTVLLAAVIAGVIGCAAEMLLRWVAVRVIGRRTSALVVIGGSAVIAALILMATASFVGGGVILTAPVVYAVVAIMCAAVTGLDTELRAQELILSEQIRAYRADEHDAHRRAEQRLFDAAQALHGRVQSTCLVAAMQLGGADHSSIWETALVDTRRVIAELRHTVPRPATTSAATLSAVVAGWSRVIDIRYRADEAAWEIADRHPEILQQVVDATSEALTNILRHGTERAATVELSASDGRLRLTVDSPGGIRSVSSDGIGLRALRARAESAHLTQHEGAVRLTVSFRSQPHGS